MRSPTQTGSCRQLSLLCAGSDADAEGPTKGASSAKRASAMSTPAHKSKKWGERYGVPRLTVSLATILLTGSTALAGELSPADASAPSQETQGAPGAVSASGGSMSRPAPFPVLPALPSDYFATTPHLLGEWPGIRSRLNDLGIDGLADRRRRSGVKSLRRRAPHSPGSRASRAAGRIRPAKEFGPPGRAISGDAGRPLGPGRRHRRWHPGAAIAQRSLRARQHPPRGAIRLGSKDGSTAGSKPRPAASHSATSSSVTLAISSI